MTVVVRVPNWLGDCVLALPALRAIRRAHAGEELLVLAHAGVEDFYRCLPEIDEVLGFNLKSPAGKQAAQDMLRRHYRDARGYLLVNSLSGAWQFFRGGLRERVGFARGFNRWLLTQAVAELPFAGGHQVRRYLGLVEAATGVTGDPADFIIPPPVAAAARARELLAGTPAADGAGYFVVHPGAQYGPAKRWPPEKFRVAAAALAARTGLVPVIAAGPHDAGSEACPERGLDLSGKTTLPMLLALLREAKFALVNDSGPMHLAAAAGTKVVALFLSTDPVATAPLGDGHRLLSADVPCRPCLERECPFGHYRCHDAITVEKVVAAATELAVHCAGAAKG